MVRYVDDRPAAIEEKFCEVLDLETWSWAPLEPEAYRFLPMEELLDHSAFFGAGAVAWTTITC